MLGKNKFEIPFKVIEKLTEWNTRSENDNQKYDKKVVVALLLMCVTFDDLALHNVKQEIKDFIFGKYIFEQIE